MQENAVSTSRLSQISLRDCIPFLFARPIKKLTKKQNAEIQDYLANYGLKLTIATYIIATIIALLIFGITSKYNPNMVMYKWLYFHTLLFFGLFFTSAYLIYKYSIGQYSFQIYARTQILISAWGGATWGATPYFLRYTDSVSQNLSIAIMATSCVFTAVWLSTFPRGALLWFLTAMTVFLSYEFREETYDYWYLFIISFFIISMSLCLFLYMNHIFTAVNNINLRHQKMLTNLLLREFEENSSDYLWQTDTDGKLIYASDKLKALCQQEKHSTQGLFSDIFLSDKINSAHLQTALKDSKPFSMLQTSITTNGTIQWWGITGNPMKNTQGDLIGFRGIGSNITAIKEIEISNNIKNNYTIITQMAGSIAHDFNNYLASISGNIELIKLQLPKKSSNISIYITNAEKCISDASHLTQELLSISNTNALSPRSIDIYTEVSTIKHDVLAIYLHDLIIDIKFKNGLYIYADKIQFRRAIRNIIENASLAMNGKGTITISAKKITYNASNLHKTLHLKNLTSEQEYYLIKIRDQGHGFSPDVFSSALQPFVTSRKNKGGTGLGLAMAYGFCRKSNGTLYIQNSKNGATIELILPISIHAAQQIKPFSEVKYDHLKGLSIILLEDDISLNQVTTKILQHYKASVRSYSSFQEFQLIKQKNIDFIIIDAGMCNQLEIETLNAFKNNNPQTHILFISGYIQNSILQKTKNIGPLLQKPFTTAELLQILDKLKKG